MLRIRPISGIIIILYNEHVMVFTEYGIIKTPALYGFSADIIIIPIVPIYRTITGIIPGKFTPVGR